MKPFPILFALVALASSASAQTYDFAADFSRTTNPNGAWSYGWVTAPGGAFNPYGSRTVNGGIESWNDTGEGRSESLAVLWYDVSNIHGIVMAPNEYALHPGPDGEWSVARFVAPVAGAFRIDALFDLVDADSPGSTDVDVWINGTPLGSSSLAGYGSSKAYATTAQLSVGDTVEFVANYGTDRSFFSDSTRLRATLSPVPEPASLAALGLGALALLRRRKGR